MIYLAGRKTSQTHMVIQALDFQAWMPAAAVDEETAGPGFQIGRKLREWLLFNAPDVDLWNTFRTAFGRETWEIFFEQRNRFLKKTLH